MTSDRVKLPQTHVLSTAGATQGRKETREREKEKSRTKAAAQEVRQGFGESHQLVRHLFNAFDNFFVEEQKTEVREVRSARELSCAIGRRPLSARGSHFQWERLLSKRESNRPAECALEMRPRN